MRMGTARTCHGPGLAATALAMLLALLTLAHALGCAHGPLAPSFPAGQGVALVAAVADGTFDDGDRTADAHCAGADLSGAQAPAAVAAPQASLTPIRVPALPGPVPPMPDGPAALAGPSWSGHADDRAGGRTRAVLGVWRT
ncbi:hypothetical protein ACFVH6_41485 [Spirillospora sp. NPDC127200]